MEAFEVIFWAIIGIIGLVFGVGILAFVCVLVFLLLCPLILVWLLLKLVDKIFGFVGGIRDRKRI